MSKFADMPTQLALGPGMLVFADIECTGEVLDDGSPIVRERADIGRRDFDEVELDMIRAGKRAEAKERWHARTGR